MGKKSKRRKREKSSALLSEDGKKASKDDDDTVNCKYAKRKKITTSQESCKPKQESCDVSQSSCHITKLVFSMAKTQATDQKHVKKKECTRTESVSVPFHGGNCSCKAGTYCTVRASKTVEDGSLKARNTHNAVTVPQRTEETSKGISEKESPKRTASKLKKQLMSPGLLSAEQMHTLLKGKCRTKGLLPRTRKDSDTKNRDASKTLSISKDSLQCKRRELIKELCQRRQKRTFKTTGWTGVTTPSASTTKQSPPSAKPTTSASSSSVVKNVSPSISGSNKSTSHKSSSAQERMCPVRLPVPFKFKIPKVVQSRPVDGAAEKNCALSKKSDEPSNPGAPVSSSTRETVQQTVQQTHKRLNVTASSSCEDADKRSSLTSRRPDMFDTVTEPWHDEMQVVEELHLARSENRLEVNIMQSYGELTCMDIDPPAEGAANSQSKQPPQQTPILVLDTNILLSHLDYVKRIQSHGLGAMGFPVVLIPWVVLQEMDSLKRGRGLSGSVAHLAIPAISYVYNCLKSRAPHLWAQSMQQAAERNDGLNAENNDDRVLQCCLQYQSVYPECALILCTNDKNLCSKALVSGVKALCKNDLQAEVERSRRGLHPLQNTQTPALPHVAPRVSSLTLSTKHTPVPPQSQERTGLSVELEEKDNKRLSKSEDEEKTGRDVSRCVSELEACLREVLSDVLEVEMKAVYEDLWLEVVLLKPPWTLKDVLQCFKKHWIAVFGQVVPRRKLQTVLNLIDFFHSGNTVDLSSTLAALREAEELVKAFLKRSSHVAGALSAMKGIFNRLRPQVEFPACDVVMNDDEDKLPTSPEVSHQEVWALFESIWSNVYQLSLEVFKALGFDPRTMQSAQPAGGPEDAVVCLHKLSSMVSQLLQAFSSILSSAPGLEEVESLLSLIRFHKIVDVDSGLMAKDLLDCFSQQDYREKLRVGGNQLMELKGALDRCQQATLTT